MPDKILIFASRTTGGGFGGHANWPPFCIGRVNKGVLDLVSSDVKRDLELRNSYYEISDKLGFGLRVDHIWVFPPLADKCTGCWIDKKPRKGERPAEHMPVVAHFRS